MDAVAAEWQLYDSNRQSRAERTHRQRKVRRATCGNRHNQPIGRTLTLQNKTPLHQEGAFHSFVPENYCVLSVVMMPVGPDFSALSFFVAMVLSTHPSAVFRSALRS